MILINGCSTARSLLKGSIPPIPTALILSSPFGETNHKIIPINNWTCAAINPNREIRLSLAVKGFFDDSKDVLTVFNLNSREKYQSPISGEVYKEFESETNKGVDIRSIDGEDPRSIIKGTVKDIYLQEKQGYFVIIEKDDVEILYGYLSKVHVSKEEIVDTQTPIGVLGTNKDGNKYLRIELKINGESENPLDYIEF